MRSRISENNIFPAFDIEEEYDKLHRLCFDRSAFGGYTNGGLLRTRPHISYNDVLQGIFLQWDLRGSFTTIEEMLFSLKISEDDFADSVTEERLLDYIQFVINAVCFIRGKVKKNELSIYESEPSLYKPIIQNCNMIVEKLGAEVLKDKNEYFIVYKDEIATAISNQDVELLPSITEYQKIDSRGDYTHKAEILCSLYKRLEPYESKLKKGGFDKLCSDTTFLLNKLARHELKSQEVIDQKFISMTDVQYEVWCDRAFQLFLACMAVVPYLEVKGDIAELKRKE